MSPNLPPDAGSSLADLLKAHLATCTEKKNDSKKENDLILGRRRRADSVLLLADGKRIHGCTDKRSSQFADFAVEDDVFATELGRDVGRDSVFINFRHRRKGPFL